jgi:hypothetical protein
VNTDADLLLGLRAMWRRYDAPDADLADRVLFALKFEALEVELLRGGEPVTAARVRGEDIVKTITFTGRWLTVVVVLPDGERTPRRIDGWLSPQAALRLQLCSGTYCLNTVADDDGRFAFDDVPAGLGRLVVHPTPGAAVELASILATPGIWW